MLVCSQESSDIKMLFLNMDIIKDMFTKIQLKFKETLYKFKDYQIKAFKYLF